MDEDFKLKVTSDISSIKTDIRHILNKIPDDDLESKIKFNRTLIVLLLVAYLGTFSYVLSMSMKH